MSIRICLFFSNILLLGSVALAAYDFLCISHVFLYFLEEGHIICQKIYPGWPGIYLDRESSLSKLVYTI
jgi:hypothetical protein